MQEQLEGSGRAAGAGFYRRGWLARAGTRVVAVAALLAAASGGACQTVAITGRQQLNLFSIEQDKELGGQAYAEVLKSSKLKDGGAEHALVQRVVGRLSKVADDPGFEWEAHVIDEPGTVNAWCMPGGKIAVYTGILPVTQDETGLAVVLGHEIGHAIARHGTERMTAQGLAESTLSVLGQQYAGVGEYQQVIGAATQLLVFQPWGRSHELEADRIGLMYMARAGYDPRQAVAFWQRMAAQSGAGAAKGSVAEFLSTHPSDQRRIEQIETYLPEALAEYQRAGGTP